MLFDLEDYSTTMRAMTDHLRLINANFDLGGLDLNLPNANGSEGYLIPTIDVLIEINQILKTKEPKQISNTVTIGGTSGPWEGDNLNLYIFQDFYSTANATKSSLIRSVKEYAEFNIRMSSSFDEIKAKHSAYHEFLDVNIAFSEKFNDFWSALHSFRHYGEGFAEGDVLPYEQFATYNYNWNALPIEDASIKFKILTQEIYDDYFVALTNFMQKIKAFMVLNGLEA